MSDFPNRQPGGLWHCPSYKALSYTWAGETGFAGAMRHTAVAGGIRGATLLNHSPMICARSKPENAPYMSYNGGASWGSTFKDILSKALSYGKIAQESGLTGAAHNLLNRAVGNTPSAPMPMERGEIAPGVRGSDLGQPAPKRNRWGGAAF